MNRFFHVACLFISFSAPILLISPTVKSEPIAFNFTFDAPSFTDSALSPLNQIFLDNSITQVNGMVAWDTDDAEFVTSNFILTSNIDGIFDSTPDELVFAPSGNLNQIRRWEIEIGGTPYILELTGLDPSDTSPNQWFGGQITSPDSPNTFELTDAGGGLTPKRIPEPTTLTLFAMALLAVFFVAGTGRIRRVRPVHGAA